MDWQTRKTINARDEVGIQHEANKLEKPQCYGNSSNNNDNKISKAKFGLHRDQVDPEFRIPFIISGYRKPNLNTSEYLKNAFNLNCNETFNIWSHAFALLYFIWKFYNLFILEYSVFNPMIWPLMTSAISICGFCLASSTAHLFSSISLSAQNVCFFMDYAAISVYSVGLGQAFFFYSRPLFPELTILRSEWPFLTVSVLTSIFVTFLCCKTRTSWQRYKYITRTIFSALPFFVNSSPYWYRVITCSNPTDCISPASLWAFQMHFFICILSAIVNTLRFPENLFPGKFDQFGQSHNLLHLFVTLAASSLFDSFHYDLIARKSKLMLASIQCSSVNTFIPFIVGIMANFGIALAFSWTVINKHATKPKHQ